MLTFRNPDAYTRITSPPKLSKFSITSALTWFCPLIYVTCSAVSLASLVSKCFCGLVDDFFTEMLLEGFEFKWHIKESFC